VLSVPEARCGPWTYVASDVHTSAIVYKDTCYNTFPGVECGRQSQKQAASFGACVACMCNEGFI